LKSWACVDNTDNEKQPVALSLGSNGLSVQWRQGCFFLHFFKIKKEGNTRFHAEVMKDYLRANQHTYKQLSGQSLL
jgi:hypothetical protein